MLIAVNIGSDFICGVVFLPLQQTSHSIIPCTISTDTDKEGEKTEHNVEEEMTKKQKIVPSRSSNQLKRISASISHSSSLSSVIDVLNQSQGQVWKCTVMSLFHS